MALQPTLEIAVLVAAALLPYYVVGRRIQAQVANVRTQKVQPGAKSFINETSDSCLDCFLYTSAPRYEDDWRWESGLKMTKAKLDEHAKHKLSDSDRLQDFKLRWSMTVHGIMNTLQGQPCMDVCALCAPAPAPLEQAGIPSLRAVHVERNKNGLDLGLWPILGIVNSTLGMAVNTLIGIPVTLAAFFVGGSLTGTVVGGLAGSQASGVVGSAAGNVLGAIAGLVSGGVSGAVYASVVEIFALAVGLWKGVGLTGGLTHCSHVGFERFANGEAFDKGTDRSEQPFRTVGFGSYGLKRLRDFTDDNATDADVEALSHCERVREHNFDMRHLDECLHHSQLCGPQGGLVIPATSADMCQWMSSFGNLYKDAIAFVDQSRLSLFSEWLNFEKVLKKVVKTDIRKEMCLSLLCELGGLANAQLDFASKAREILGRSGSETKQQQLLLMAVEKMADFLQGCKADYGLTACVEEGPLVPIEKENTNEA